MFKLLSKIFNISSQLDDAKKPKQLPKTEEFGRTIATYSTAVAIVCCGAPLVISKLAELFSKPLPNINKGGPGKIPGRNNYSGKK